MSDENTDKINKAHVRLARDILRKPNPNDPKPADPKDIG